MFDISNIMVYDYINSNKPTTNKDVITTSNKQRKFSRKAIFLATESIYGDRLLQITVERIRLTRMIIDSRNVPRRQYEDALLRISELDNERDAIIQKFEN